MSTPTLDEIEAQARAHAETAKTHDGYVRMDVLRLSDALLGLVAHVRALGGQLGGLDAMVDSHTAGLQNAHTRGHAHANAITALEERANNIANHVFGPRSGGPGLIDETADLYADVEKHAARITALERRVESLTGFAVKDVERIAALEEKVAALEPLAKEARAAWKPVATEMDRLRAENGKLREENGSLHTAKIDWGQENAELRAENAELRKRLEDSRPPTSQAVFWEGRWPAPHPIETAPLGPLLTWRVTRDVGVWVGDYPSEDDTMETWRAVLKKWGRTCWMPMPPPPGGGK